MGQKDISVSSDNKGREETRDFFIRPAVDIFESDEGLTLMADLPGVTKENLQIDIDRGLLTVQAKGKSHVLGEPVRREFLHGSYYRQFQLPDEIDSEKIAADVKDGVLTLLLPKAEAAKPRRIEIMTS
ncbi:MAG: Hsp20/alpha crystallin family protein [Desulfuromonadaceae bacterium]|nr:Hsp20/alpha crystallin family protein [Desulfuromonadaceae bacterium]